MTTGSYEPMGDRSSRTSVVHTALSARLVADERPPPLSARSIASDVPEIGEAEAVEVVADDRTHESAPRPPGVPPKDDVKTKLPAAGTVSKAAVEMRSELEPTYSDEFEQSGGAESVRSISTAPSAPETARSELAIARTTPHVMPSSRAPALVTTAAASEKIPTTITSTGVAEAKAAQADAKPTAPTKPAAPPVQTEVKPQEKPAASPAVQTEVKPLEKPAAPPAVVERALKEEIAKLAFKLGDRVIVGGVQYGTVRYIGVPKLSAGLMVGVELDTPEGRHDGRYEGGERYFECRPNHGIFAPPHRVVLVPKPTEAAASVAAAGQKAPGETSANTTVSLSLSSKLVPEPSPAARQLPAAPAGKREQLNDAQKKALADAIAEQLVHEQIDTLAALFASKIPRAKPSAGTPAPPPASAPAASAGNLVTPPSAGGVPAAPPPTPASSASQPKPKPPAPALAPASASSMPAGSSILVLQTPPQPRPPPGLISLASSTVFGKNAEAAASSQAVLEQASQRLSEMSKLGDQQSPSKETPVPTPSSETPQALTPAYPIIGEINPPAPPAPTPPLEKTSVPTPTVDKPPAVDTGKPEDATSLIKKPEHHEPPKKPAVPIRKLYTA